MNEIRFKELNTLSNYEKYKILLNLIDNLNGEMNYYVHTERSQYNLTYNLKYYAHEDLPFYDYSYNKYDNITDIFFYSCISKNNYPNIKEKEENLE